MLYPKIETLYDRDPDTFKVIPGRLRCPEFGLVSKWLVTEKIDGTNIRVHLTCACQGYCSDCGSTGGCVIAPRVKFQGRTDNAQTPPFLLEELQRMFPVDKVQAAFDPGVNVTLFGEGYGARIQKGGGDYREGVSFRLFDVVVHDENRNWWLTWDNVEDVAEKLGINTVPVLTRGENLEQAAKFVSGLSSVALMEKVKGPIRAHEGIVAQTDPLLFDRRGHRVVWKLKARDLA